MEKFKNGIYVGAYFVKSLNSQLYNLIYDIRDKIQDFLTENKIKYDYPEDPFHITLICSKSIPKSDISEKDILSGISENKKLKLTFKDFKIFPYLKRKCIVIEWKSELAEKLNKRLLSFGLEPTYKEYIPHTSFLLFDELEEKELKLLENFLNNLSKTYFGVTHSCDITLKIEDLAN